MCEGKKLRTPCSTRHSRNSCHLTLCRADLTIEKGVESVVDSVAGLNGGLHGLIHCAASGVHKSFDELTLRHYDWTFSLNVRAFFDLVKRLLPRFAAHASIVAVSSQRGTACRAVVFSGRSFQRGIRSVGQAPGSRVGSRAASGSISCLQGQWRLIPGRHARTPRNDWLRSRNALPRAARDTGRGGANRSVPLFRCGPSHHRPYTGRRRRCRIACVASLIGA